MDRVFVLTLISWVIAFAMRPTLSHAHRMLITRIVCIYYLIVITIFQTYTLQPILAILFPFFALFNVLFCSAMIGVGSPKLMRTEQYLILFYIFIAYYVFSSIMGNYPMTLFVKKVGSIMYIVTGVILGRMLLYYRLEDWMVRSIKYWGLPVIFYFSFVVAPQVSDFTDVSGDRLQQLGDIDLLNPNTFGLLVAPLCVLSMLAFLKQKRGMKKMIPALIAVMSVMLLLRIGSRTSFLAAIIPSFYIVSIIVKNRIIRFVLSGILVLSLVYLFFFTKLPELYRVFQITSEGEISLSSRDIIWQENLEGMSPIEHVFGTGGQYIYSSYEAGGGVNGLHAALMESYFTTGMVGSAFAVMALLIFFRKAYKLQQYGAVPFCFCLMGLLTGVGECALLRGHWLVTILFGIGLGLLSADECLIRNRMLGRPGFLIPPPGLPGTGQLGVLRQ